MKKIIKFFFLIIVITLLAIISSFIIKIYKVDKDSPIIIGVKDLETDEEKEIDLLKNIKVQNNKDDNIKVTIEGKYDINKPGIYNLKYVAIDNSNNITKKSFKLTVNKIYERTSKNYKIINKDGLYYINNILVVNKSYSIPSSYNPGKLLDNFNKAYKLMNQDAKKEGINLYIRSGFRSYSTQSLLYNNYVKKDGKVTADKYSARAGYSEHQTGLAADINSLEQNFINTKDGKWLNDNCYKYGFIIRYPKGKESVTGYMYEPWHIRYVGVDIATKIYNKGNWITIEEYLGITSKY